MVSCRWATSGGGIGHDGVQQRPPRSARVYEHDGPRRHVHGLRLPGEPTVSLPDVRVLGPAAPRPNPAMLRDGLGPAPAASPTVEKHGWPFGRRPRGWVGGGRRFTSPSGFIGTSGCPAGGTRTSQVASSSGDRSPAIALCELLWRPLTGHRRGAILGSGRCWRSTTAALLPP